MRPTCNNCGEALEVRMHACPRCWELIEEPAYFAEGAVIPEPAADLPAVQTPADAPSNAAAQQYTAPAPAMTLTQEAPVVPPMPDITAAWEPTRPPAGIRFLRVVLIGLVSGLFAAAGLVALEAVGPRLRGTLPEQVGLERQGFGHLDFAIGVPTGWEADEEVGGKPGARFVETDGVRGDVEPRSFQVLLDEETFDRARELADRPPSSAEDYDEINIIAGLRLDGRRAFRHQYTDGDEYREHWWIERGGETYRIEFSAPVSRQEESAQLFVRIARTFDVL